MSAKNIVTLGLLTFVAITIGVAATRGAREVESTGDTQGGAARSTQAGALPDGVMVYYFHGNTRCPTCRKIEAYTRQTVETRFARELGEGLLQWETRNYESAESQPLSDRYEVLAPIVILARMQAGREIAWTSLDKVWDLTHDPGKFMDYVQDEINKSLASAEG